MAHKRALSDLRTAVRDNLDEPTPAFWTNAQLLRFINRAKNRVWNEAKKLKADYFDVTRTSTDGSLTILGETYAATGFQIVAGTRDYTLPPDFSEMRLIEVTTSGYEHVRFTYLPLTHPTFRAMLRVTDNQAPSEFYYTIVGERTLRITPFSDTTLNLRITYTPVIADLAADTDTLEMPWPLPDAVEAFATATAMVMDRDPNAAVWEQRGRAIVADMFGAHARQSQDPEFVQDFLAEWSDG